jgi:exodeoxyribonuclease V alpha subunit
MRRPVELSPLGTAREAITSECFHSPTDNTSASQSDLLEWCSEIREPLKALYNVEDEIVFVAWELARWQEDLGLVERQAVILLILTAIVHLREGSTRIPLRTTAGRTHRLDFATKMLQGVQSSPDTGGMSPVQAVELVETLIDTHRLGTLIGSPEEFKPLIVSGEHLYLQKLLSLENRFVEVLNHHLATGTMFSDDVDMEQALRDVLARPVFRNGQPVRLTDEQESAVRSCARSPLTIISGGPGTGKTTIVLSILRVLCRLRVSCEEIALAAPTGKAANRLGEAIKVGRINIVDPAQADLDLANLTDPRTLHRLLGYSQRTRRFTHHGNNRLAERVVIIDEGSMIDLALMERLIRSLRDGSRLILLGDAHQLPSVAAGAVLRDLLAADGGDGQHKSCGIWLTDNHRMRPEDANGRHVLAVARAIDRGDQPVLQPIKSADHVIIERRSVADVTFQGVEFLVSPAGPSALDEFLDCWYDELVRSRSELDEAVQREYKLVDGYLALADQEALHRCFHHWEQLRILCFTRVSLFTGADHINAALHKRALDQRDLTPQRDNGFIAGEPVMMQINDYNRGVFNGDQGLVLNVSERGWLQQMAVFPRPDGFAAFHLESLRPVLLHSYAMTVHKAQGSEFDKVVIILPDRDLPINTREILYTGLTRSRGSVVIIGGREILEAGIARTIARDSGVGEKLRNTSP